VEARRLTRPLTRGVRSTAARVLPAPSSDRGAWVFGGASGRSYSDNSSVLHRHVLLTRPETATLWAIDGDSPDRAVVEQLGGCIERRSLAAHRLALAADVIVFSHGVHDVPGMMFADGAVRVRLGHGLTAFGRTRGRMPRSTQRMTQAVDLAPVASRMEQDHKVDWGFPREKLPITGLPRWDDMVAHRGAGPTRQRPLVLYAPTSRPWHTDVDATPRGALKPIHELLHSPRLAAMLAAGVFDLGIYFHQITRYRFGPFEWLPPGVEVITEERRLPEFIATSSLVVSDYSSILWDALYVDVPVILFQFDRAEHERLRGSYLDLRQRLFGPNVDTADATLDALEMAVADGFQLEGWADDRERWQERAFAYRDADNCARVVERIASLTSGRSRTADRT
jgi:CDP-glycerol glycerophosphotransferase